ncbi:acyl carrier protein [Streptomyces hilarionis]|uniref:acyl carrier protein n=1 Tax=Streptomyces hilarionis TaxID=2839954 RepID=UPI00211A3341|nr:acyl carrier protein [Streptomyces hilarionis]MCQ9131375.1 acyl carrier protein [Streptomyces hilarionis]
MTSRTPWIQELSDTPPSERRALLESLVVAEFKRELMMDETEEMPLGVSYFELGLTSLGAVDTRRRLEGELGRTLDAAFLFNHPTVGDLVAFLTAEVLPDLFSAGPPTPEAPQDAGVPTSAKHLVNDILKELYQ